MNEKGLVHHLEVALVQGEAVLLQAAAMIGYLSNKMLDIWRPEGLWTEEETARVHWGASLQEEEDLQWHLSLTHMLQHSSSLQEQQGWAMVLMIELSKQNSLKY